MVPRVILFREEHSRRSLVPKVDFVSAPGWSPDHVHRPGGPYALITGMALFMFEKRTRRFRLSSVHPGHSVEEVLDNTGFAFERSEPVAVTAAPEPERLTLIRGQVREDIAETYPAFAATRLAQSDRKTEQS